MMGINSASSHQSLLVGLPAFSRINPGKQGNNQSSAPNLTQPDAGLPQNDIADGAVSITAPYHSQQDNKTQAYIYPYKKSDAALFPTRNKINAESTEGKADGNNPEADTSNTPTSEAREDSSSLTGAANEAADDKGNEDSKTGAEEKESSEPGGRMGTDGAPLSKEELIQIQKLQQRDGEVRRHEMAHIAASGGYASGGATLQYQRGPDGRRYAVGGEVSIDSSSESDPQATLRKMRIVRRAAMAPANPSSQDRKVAAAAARKEFEAQRLMADEQRQEMSETRERYRNNNKDTSEATTSESGNNEIPEATSAADNILTGKSTNSTSQETEKESSHSISTNNIWRQNELSPARNRQAENAYTSETFTPASSGLALSMIA